MVDRYYKAACADDKNVETVVTTVGISYWKACKPVQLKAFSTLENNIVNDLPHLCLRLIQPVEGIPSRIPIKSELKTLSQI